MKKLFTRFLQFLRQPALHRARQLVIGVVGGTVVLVGIAMIVLPGPAFLVIPLGLAILGTEFYWARRWLKKARALLPNKSHPVKAPPSPDETAAHPVPSHDVISLCYRPTPIHKHASSPEPQRNAARDSNQRAAKR